MSEIPAGWYPDPAGSDQYRYWDGSGWTYELSDAPVNQPSPSRENLTPSVSKNGDNQEASVGLFGRKKHMEALQVESQTLKEQVASLMRRNHELAEVVDKYGLDSDLERERVRGRLDEEVGSLEARVAELKGRISLLTEEHEQAQKSLISMRSAISLQSFGLYDYEHPAETSVQLSSDLEKTRKEIRQAISLKKATTAAGNFLFNNSEREGSRFVRDMSALLLRAYNAEAENCVKGAKAGNLEANIKRLENAKAQIERLGKMIELRISQSFHKLRIHEIELATRYLYTIGLEKDAEKEHRAQLREDARVARELEREMQKLASNEQMAQSALAAATANNDEVAIEVARTKLAAIQENIANVNALAANRRMGHVYVISNIGAFGPDVVKIGMTRRLEPMDRVRELGDASVPFRFDTHAIIWSEDAVALETALHRKFEAKRINKINAHREFFRVTPTEVLEELKSEAVVVKSFQLEPAAEEYRASIGEIPAVSVIYSEDIPIDDDIETEANDGES